MHAIATKRGLKPAFIALTMSALLAGCSDNGSGKTDPSVSPVSTVAPTAPVTPVTPPSATVPTGLTLVAGNIGGSGNLDGSGAAARFSYPTGSAIDSAGNLYVVDAGNLLIRRITPAGVVSTFAGRSGVTGSTDGPLAAALFSFANGVAIDATGNLYVADTGNNTIRKIAGGVVTTIAGTAGITGAADGSGAAASFNQPSALCIDGAGNVYVADTGNFTIRKITPAGVVSTFVGTPHLGGWADGSGAAVRLGQVLGLALDGAGNLYATEQDNEVIRRITPGGAVTTIAGAVNVPDFADGTGTAAHFHAPAGIASDAAGNLYVVDSQNFAIRTVTPAGVVRTLAGSGAVGSSDGTGSSARFDDPFGISLDALGNLYVDDTFNQTIRKVTPGGVVTTLAGIASVAGATDALGTAATFDLPRGIVGDTTGNVYLSETGNEIIRKISAAGVVSTLAGTPHAIGSADGSNAAAQFDYPTDLTIDNAGNLYVADSGNNAIRKVTPTGVVTTFAGVSGGARGSADGTAAAARFYGPEAITIDPLGNLIVVDTFNDTIRRITPAAVVTTLAGTPDFVGFADGTGPAASFYDPMAVCSDNVGNFYVADTDNDIIRKVTPAGVVTTVAGTAFVTGSADGTGAAAQFNGPAGIACDSIGNVYVADTNNHTVRKITAAGVVTTVVGNASRQGLTLGALPATLGNVGGIGIVGTRLYILSDNAVLSTGLP